MISVSSIRSQYLDFCLQRKNLSGHTPKAYGSDLSQFEHIAGNNTDIRLITKETLDHFHRRLTEQELAAASIKRKVACVRSMFRWAELEDIIPNNPFHQFRTVIKLPRKLPRNVATSDLYKMIQHGKSDLGIDPNSTYQADKLLRAIDGKSSLNKLSSLMALELMLSTGMRVGELSGIYLSNINIEERKIKILGKGARERFVYLPDQELCELASAYQQARLLVKPANNNLLVTAEVNQLIRYLAGRRSNRSTVTSHEQCINQIRSKGFFYFVEYLRL